MKSRNEKLDEGLRAIDPAKAGDLDPSDAGADKLLRTVLASDAESQETRTRGAGTRSPARSTRRLPGRRVLASVAVGLVVLAGIVVGLPGGDGGGRTTLPALARVAEAAAAQPAPDTGLPYVYVKTRENSTDTSVAHGQAWSVYHIETDEEWIAKDGSGRVRRVVAAPEFVTPEDREAWEAADKISFLVHGFNGYSEEQDLPVGHFDERFPGAPDGSLSGLPTDPDELAEWLTNRAINPAFGGGAFPLSVKTLTLIAEILQNPLATPELRAALYEAEGQIPGIEYLGPATDQIGRRGIAIGAKSANSGAPTLYSLIFDPETSQVLATQQTMLSPPSGLPQTTPRLTSSKMYLVSGTTASLHSRP
jgi:hypothetical protein